MRILFIPFYILIPVSVVLMLSALSCEGRKQQQEDLIFAEIVQQRKHTRDEVLKALAVSNDQLTKEVYKAMLVYYHRSAAMLEIGEDMQDTDMELLQTHLVPDKDQEVALLHAIRNNIARTKVHYQKILSGTLSDEGKAKLYMLLPALQGQLDDLDELIKNQK